MHPVAAVCTSRAASAANTRVVDVQAAWRVQRGAVMRKGGVDVLDQMVPRVPLPNHLAAFRKVGRHFEHRLRPHQLRVGSPGRGSFLHGPVFPRQHEDVSGGHEGEVVVVVGAVVGPVQGPQKFAIPRTALNATANAASRKRSVHAASTHQAAVLQQVRSAARNVLAFPRLDDLPAVVNQVGGRASHGVEQRVAVKRFGGVEEGADRLGLGVCRASPKPTSDNPSRNVCGDAKSANVHGQTVAMRSFEMKDASRAHSLH